MKKPEVNKKIYEEWDRLKARIDEKKVLFSRPIGFRDVYPLTSAIMESPKITGRSRKQDDDLILVPRSVLRFLTDEALLCAYQRDPEMKKEKGGGIGE